LKRTNSMDFKFDWLKGLSSLIVSIIVGIFYSNSKMVFGEYSGFWHSFFPAFLGAFIIIYLVWSALDKS